MRLTLRPLPDLAALAPRWRALEDSSDAPAFLRWSWVGARLADAPVPVMLLEASEGDALVALAFAAVRRVWRKGILPVRVLYLNDFGDARHDIACVEYNDLLMPAGVEARVRAQVFAQLAALKAPRFDAIAVRSCLAPVSQALAAAGLAPLVEARAPSAAIDLAKARAAGSVLALVSANTRQQIRRAMRLYEDGGPLGCQRADTTAVALEWLAKLALLHAERWGEAAIIDTAYRAFLERLLARGLDDGTAEIVRVAAGDQVLGYCLNLIDPGGVRFYLGALAYDGDARYKPGLVTHALVAQQHADAGRPLYDFLAGDARYKTQLGQPTVIMDSVLFRRSRLLFRIEDALRRIKRQAFGAVAA